MHSCQEINTWDQPMSHWRPIHVHLGNPLAITRPRPGRGPSILSVMTDGPGWRCWHDPSRHHMPSIPEIKTINFITKFRYEEQYDTIEKWKSLYSLYHPAESDHWGGINTGFKLEPIIKIIFSKLRLRKWIMRSCRTYRHAKLKLIRRHQRQIMPRKLRMTSSLKSRPRAIGVIISHFGVLRDV